ncbi:hypothetical protein CAPTEDRAFT_225492 [Capitella teleta]|uniref:G-protein coupled receptors family 1 profile domain-containing protein n=1 Tax=Capitella teleta TaxID=283909 RepID=R7TEW7_CAPTE|nr:hypothetical protein CAPTEDRAFT_225492 [Capitella teleta]|eukprot:ELT90022.1 hypothetical protein CAPTEDRAFT_225492 [Capitella teleta]
MSEQSCHSLTTIRRDCGWMLQETRVASASIVEDHEGCYALGCGLGADDEMKCLRADEGGAESNGERRVDEQMRTERLPAIKDVGGCYGDTIKVTCSRDHVINILHDYHGLSKDGACHSSVDVMCSVPTIFHRSDVRRQCNGQQTCLYTVRDRNECSYNGKLNQTNFLHVDYECISSTSVKNLCEAKVWTTKSGYLTSPLYPQMYPKGLDCACRIFSNTSGSSIGIQTLEYRISDEVSCTDWLYVITDFSSEQLCGTLARHYVGKDISLLLHTKKDGFKGFMIHFEALAKNSLATIVCDSVDPKDDSRESIAHFHDKLETRDDISQYFRHLAVASDNSASELSSSEQVSKSRERPSDKIPGLTETTIKRPRVRIMPKELFAEKDLPQRKPHQYKPTVHTISACFGEVLDFKCEETTDVLRIIDEFYGTSKDKTCKYKRGDCIVRAKTGTRVAQQSCQGRKQCVDVLVTRMQCKPSVTNYMEVIYECVPGDAVYNMADAFMMVAPFGYLSTPGFPNDYPPNTNSTCLVTSVREGKEVEVSVVHLSLPHGDDCRDSVDISRDKAVTRLCNAAKRKSTQARFRAKAIMIVFKSDAAHTASGAWLHFRGLGNGDARIQCIGNSNPISDDGFQPVEVSGKVLHIDRSEGSVKLSQYIHPAFSESVADESTNQDNPQNTEAKLWFSNLLKAQERPTPSPDAFPKSTHEVHEDSIFLHPQTTALVTSEEESDEMHGDAKIASTGAHFSRDTESTIMDEPDENPENDASSFVIKDYIPIETSFISSERDSHDFKMPNINFQVPNQSDDSFEVSDDMELLSNLDYTDADTSSTMTGDSHNEDKLEMIAGSSGPLHLQSLPQMEEYIEDHTERTVEENAAFQAGKIIHNYVFPVIIAIGLLGNTLSVIVLARRQQRKFISTYFYLLLLAVADSAMLLLGLFLRTKPYIADRECQVVVFFFHTLSLCCIYLIVFMTLDKCIVIWWPLKARIYCTQSRVGLTCGASAVLNVCYNIPHAFNYSLVDGYCMAFPLQKTSGFFSVYIWLHFCVSCVVPFIIIITCNCCIVRKLRSRDRRQLSGRTARRTDKITGVLLLVSITMLLLTLPQYVRYVYYSIVNYKETSREHARYILWYNITNKLFFTNHSINFISCSICGSNFREELKRLFQCKTKKARTFSTSSARLITLETADNETFL